VDEVSFLLGCDTASYPRRTDTALKMVHFTKKLVRDIVWISLRDMTFIPEMLQYGVHVMQYDSKYFGTV